MREILFRGKSMDDNEWIYGGALHQTDSYGDKVDKWFIIDGTYTNDYDIGEPIRAIPETIGQYTGLIDKNGKKIFEGDIIKAYFQPQNFKNPPCAIGSVIFENGTFKVVVYVSKKSTEYKVFEKENIVAYSIEHNFLDRCYVLEVTGNINDNPELAERSKQHE